MIEINKIYNENCLDTMKKIPDNSIDLIITSPPYDSIRTYNGYVFDFENIALELSRIIKEGRNIIWVVNDETKEFCESLTSFKQAIFFVEKCKLNLLDTMIYAKKSGMTHNVNSRKTYCQRFEYIFVFSKGNPIVFNPIKDKKNMSGSCSDIPKIKDFTSSNYSRKKDGTFYQDLKINYAIEQYSYRTNIWEYGTGKNISSKDVVAFEHPAIFPENLAKDCIISWSNENDLVYDPFMGSGTVAKMAIVTKRNYIGSEISKEYCDNIIDKRILKYNSAKTLRNFFK